MSGNVGESSLRFLFLGFLRSRVEGAIPTKVTKFPAGVALPASRTLVELSAVVNIVSIRLMVRTPGSWLTIFAQRDLDLLWHIDVGISIGELALLSWAQILLLLEECRGWCFRAEFLLCSARPRGKRYINACSTFLRLLFTGKQAGGSHQNGHIYRFSGLPNVQQQLNKLS